MFNVSYLNEEGRAQIWVLADVPDHLADEVIFINADGGQVTLGMASEWQGVYMVELPDVDILQSVKGIEHRVNELLDLANGETDTLGFVPTKNQALSEEYFEHSINELPEPHGNHGRPDSSDIDYSNITMEIVFGESDLDF